MHSSPTLPLISGNNIPIIFEEKHPFSNLSQYLSGGDDSISGFCHGYVTQDWTMIIIVIQG